MPLVQKNLADIVTLSRASARTVTSSAGLLTALASGAFAIDYNPSTLAVRGMPVEEQRTNNLRNPRLEGAAAGTPGTTPTHCAITTVSGISTQIVELTSEDGIPCLGVRWFGTATATGNLNFYFETAAGLVALTAQTWTFSPMVRLTAGAATGINSFNIIMDENTSGGVFVTAGSQAISTPTSDALATQRQSFTRTLSGGPTVAAIRPYLNMPVTNGAVIDITLRLATGNCEQGAFASSLIFPPAASPAAATRLADSLTIGTLSPWYSATEGTIYVEAERNAGTGSVTTPTVVQIDGGSVDNRLNVGVSANGVSATVGLVVVGAVAQAAFTATSTAINKTAMVYKANDFASSINGAPSQVDSLGTVPTVTTLRIGSNSSAFFNGWIRKIIYYPSRKTNAQIEAMTA